MKLDTSNLNELKEYFHRELRVCGNIAEIALVNGFIDNDNARYLHATRWELIGINKACMYFGIKIVNKKDKKVMDIIDEADLEICQRVLPLGRATNVNV